MEKFVIGHFYKLDEIRAVLGGPLLASIATKDNKVLYVKFKRDKSNPNLPNEIWIKGGPIQSKSAIRWVESGLAVPMFFKEPTVANGQWKYIGLFKAKILFTEKEAMVHTKDSSIALVLKIH